MIALGFLPHLNLLSKWTIWYAKHCR